MWPFRSKPTTASRHKTILALTDATGKISDDSLAIVWRCHDTGRAFCQPVGRPGDYWRDVDHDWTPMTEGERIEAWAAYFQAIEDGRLPPVVSIPEGLSQ